MNLSLSANLALRLKNTVEDISAHCEKETQLWIFLTRASRES